MEIAENRKSSFLSVFAIVLAILAWVAAVCFLRYTLGDYFDDDPIREAQVRAQARTFSAISMGAFLSFLALSSWLAGLANPISKLSTYVVLAIHTVMILVALYFFDW